MKRWVLWAGLLISALLLVYALRGLRLAEFWRDLQQADLRWLAPGIALYFAAVYCRAWRWAYLLRPLNAGLTARGLYPTVVIGYMGNNIYPARIGEVLKAWILRKDTGVPMPSSLATVIIERVMDGLAMVAFVLIGLPNVPALGATALRGVTIALVLFLAVIAVFFWLALAPETAARLAGIVIQKLAPARARAPLTGLATQFLAGTRSLSRPRDLALIVASTLATWLTETGKYWCIAQAFGLALPFTGLMLINGVSNLFTAIPGGPGAVGTFDAGGVLAATALGVPAGLASAYVLTLHVVLWLPVTLLGAFLMARRGMGWADLKMADSARA